MTRNFKSYFSSLLLLVTTLTYAQVGIGTSNVNTSARLQVDASNKGFLPPRVSLTGTADVSTISIPATGLLVYNTATAGTSPSNVIPGFYYYDGVKWQRIINQQPVATVSFNQNTPTTGGVVFTPNIPSSTDYIYVSITNNSHWIYNGAAYVTYTPPASTPWFQSGGTNDAGSSKTGTVYRTGSVGIGANNTPAASAILDVNSTSKGFLPPRMTQSQRDLISAPAAGLLIYQTDNTPGFYYYNGSAWAQGIGPTGATGATGPSGNAVPAWISNGPITFGATTSAPNTGLTSANNMSFRQLGLREYEVVMSFKTTGSFGTAGTGDYLFTLPSGLSFDQTLPWQTTYTSNIGNCSPEFYRYAIPMSFGYVSSSSNPSRPSVISFIVPYSATQFRIIICDRSSDCTAPWCANWYGLQNDFGGNWSFRFTSL